MIPRPFTQLEGVGDQLPICPVGLAWNGDANSPECEEVSGGEEQMMNDFVSDIGAMPDPNSLPRPRMLLWHEGLLGEAIMSVACVRAYLKNIVDFANESGKIQEGDVICIVLQSAVNYKNFAMTPELIASAFVDLLDPKFTAGVVAYVRTADAGWEYANSSSKMALGGNPFDHSTLALSSSGCSEGDWDQSTPQGCPNQLGQAIEFVRDVNKAATKNQITFFLADGEDMSPYSQPNGWATMQELSRDSGIKVGGYAKGLPLEVPLSTEAERAEVDGGYTPRSDFSFATFPEVYWNLGDLAPCGGSQYQMANQVPLCTRQTIYQRYRNNPQKMLAAMHASSKRLQNDTLNSLRTHALASAPTGERWTANADGGDTTWPMFSLEMLSERDCLASTYGGTDPKTQVCGTFDGFGNWDWDKFVDFSKLFAWAYNVNQVGVYESQFIMSHWMKDSTFLPPPEECRVNGGGGGGGGGGHEECPEPTSSETAYFLQPGDCSQDSDCCNNDNCQNSCGENGTCVCIEPSEVCPCQLNGHNYAQALGAQLFSDCPEDRTNSGCSIPFISS